MQQHTSTRNRLHCILDGAGLPPPTEVYTQANAAVPSGPGSWAGAKSGDFQDLPLFIVAQNGRAAVSRDQRYSGDQPSP